MRGAQEASSTGITRLVHDELAAVAEEGLQVGIAGVTGSAFLLQKGAAAGR
jgi:hypothetical protein